MFLNQLALLFLQQGPNPQALAPIDWLNNYIHLITWPALLAIVGTFLWKTRGSVDKFFKQVEMDRSNIANTAALATAIKATVENTRDNHLAHLAGDMQIQKDLQARTIAVLDKQTELLSKQGETLDKSVEIQTSMDKALAILVDRSRPN